MACYYTLKDTRHQVTMEPELSVMNCVLSDMLQVKEEPIANLGKMDIVLMLSWSGHKGTSKRYKLPGQMSMSPTTFTLALLLWLIPVAGQGCSRSSWQGETAPPIRSQKGQPSRWEELKWLLLCNTPSQWWLWVTLSGGCRVVTSGLLCHEIGRQGKTPSSWQG